MWALLAFALGGLPGMQYAGRAATPVSKQVLAFYYGWYGNPQVSGRWAHWRDVDADRKTIGGSTHYPTLGAYDSHDPKVVDEHCREAKEAGLTGFIATWWGQNDFHDHGLPLLLDTAQKHGLKVTIYYETVKPRNAPAPPEAIKDILYVLEHYAKHPAWLRVNGKPVLFVYGRAVNEIKLAGWQSVIAEVNQKYAGGVIFIGDQISPKAAQVFDGIHTYNITGKTKGMSVEDLRLGLGRSTRSR
jgi:glycoprotein endo-alpha-1,2-mannosidase